MDSGLGTPLKCSKQIPENTWFEENYAQNVSGWNNLTFPNTSVLLSETAKLHCGENMPDGVTFSIHGFYVIDSVLVVKLGELRNILGINPIQFRNFLFRQTRQF